MDVLDRFVQGDVNAFETLFRRHQQQAYSWIVRIVRDEATAQDLTVETFWRIYKARARFDPSRSFGAWTRRIATNVALSYLGKARVEMRLVERLSRRSQPVMPAQLEVREAIESAFGELGPKLRVVATLALVEQMTYGEIAKGLGISEAAVKSRMFRAVRKLRRRLNTLGVRI